MFRREGLWALLAAFVLRLLQRRVSMSLAVPYNGRSEFGRALDGWLDVVVPVGLDVLSLTAVVVAGVLFARPFLQRIVDVRSADLESVAD